MVILVQIPNIFTTFFQNIFVTLLQILWNPTGTRVSEGTFTGKYFCIQDEGRGQLPFSCSFRLYSHNQQDDGSGGLMRSRGWGGGDGKRGRGGGDTGRVPPVRDVSRGESPKNLTGRGGTQPPPLKKNRLSDRGRLA